MTIQITFREVEPLWPSAYAVYDVTVTEFDPAKADSISGHRIIATERVDSHNRADGWRELARKLVYNRTKPESDR